MPSSLAGDICALVGSAFRYKKSTIAASPFVRIAAGMRSKPLTDTRNSPGWVGGDRSNSVYPSGILIKYGDVDGAI